MGVEDLNLGGLTSLDKVAKRVRSGTETIDMAKALGLWTEEVHKATQSRPAFPSNLSELTPGQLSDLYARWTAEFGRVVELCGWLDGLEGALKIRLKSTQLSVRARIRRNQPPEAKALSVAALSDMVEEDPAVVDLVEQSMLLVVLAGQLKAAREVSAQNLATISREIAFRDAQMKARIY